MLKVEGLSVSIGPIPIIRNATLTVNEGEMCGLIGRNGAGKTTLLRALMGALPASGKADLGHVDLLTLPGHKRAAHGVGYMPEDRRLVPEFTVEENIRLPTWSTQVDGVDQRLQWIYSIMPEVAQFAKRRALELSGGQQKMVALARALMAGTRISVARRAVRGTGAGAGPPARRGAGQPQDRGRVGADRRIRTRFTCSICWRAPISSSAARSATRGERPALSRAQCIVSEANGALPNRDLTRRCWS